MQIAPGVSPARGARNVIDGGCDLIEYMSTTQCGCITQGFDTGQAGATSERIVTDGSDAGGNGNARQALAVVKGIVANAGDTGRDGNSRQGSSGLERTVADGLQPRPQGDAR